MRDTPQQQPLLDLCEVRLIARRESDSVVVGAFGGASGGVDRLRERESERHISPDDDVVPKRSFRLGSKPSCAYPNRP